MEGFELALFWKSEIFSAPFLRVHPKCARINLESSLKRLRTEGTFLETLEKKRDCGRI